MVQRSGVLIETYWNVKVYLRLLFVIPLFGINRNILECKDNRTRNLQYLGYSINRNILECKVWKIYKRIFCWSCINRNILECKERNQGVLEIEEQVLIETYWNVKADEAGDDRTGSGGINRNILECKVILCPAQRAGFFSINRNILECKVIRSTRPSRRSVY